MISKDEWFYSWMQSVLIERCEINMQLALY